MERKYFRHHGTVLKKNIFGFLHVNRVFVEANDTFPFIFYYYVILNSFCAEGTVVHWTNWEPNSLCSMQLSDWMELWIPIIKCAILRCTMVSVGRVCSQLFLYSRAIHKEYTYYNYSYVFYLSIFRWLPAPQITRRPSTCSYSRSRSIVMSFLSIEFTHGCTKQKRWRKNGKKVLVSNVHVHHVYG